MADSMVIEGRAWGVEAAMGHCILWSRPQEPELPGWRYNGQAYAREMVDLLRWGVERGINGIGILHGDRGGYADPGGILLEQEAQELGIPYAVGGHVGHGYPHLLPAGLFTRRPELFRMDPQGARSRTGNLCTANVEALGRAAGELSLLWERHPRARLARVWPEDVHGGSWCNCPRCRDLAPVQQYARLTSAVAGVLDARMPGAQVDFLLYHDSLTGLPAGPIAADGTHFLPPNVYAEYAPRERCYAHAIDDPACPRNRLYWQSLLHAKEVFEGRVDVFEYYGDTILWHYFNVAIPHVIAADLAAYHRIGAREVQALAFGTYSLWAHGLNLAVFALLGSGMETDVDAAIARYAGERFGASAASAMVAYYQALEAAQADYLGFCGYDDSWMQDLRWLSVPSPWYGEHRHRVAASQEAFGQVAELLAAAVARGQGEPYVAHLKAEQVHLEMTRIELVQLDARLAAAERATAGASRPPTEQETAQRVATRQRQWELGLSVVPEIRGEAFGALAP
jgi:hypothetical protein